MNFYQKIISIFYLTALIALTVFIVPFRVYRNQIVFDTIWSDRGGIDLYRIIIEIILITATGLILFFIYSKKKESATLNIKSKKIIAREFILLIAIIIISVISFLITYPYNSHQRKQIESITNSIKIKRDIADSLANDFYKKNDAQYEFNKKINDSNIDTVGAWKRLYFLAVNDSIKYKWENVWDKHVVDYTKSWGYDSPEKFQKFILANSISSIDTENKKQSEKVVEEIERLKLEREEVRGKILYYNEQINFGVKVFGIAALLLFAFRYFIYSIIWSVKVLRTK